MTDTQRGLETRVKSFVCQRWQKTYKVYTVYVLNSSRIIQYKLGAIENI